MIAGAGLCHLVAFVISLIAIVTAARADQATPVSLESFREQVITTAKESWQVVSVAPDRSGDEGKIDLFLRRAHYPPYTSIDIRTLYEDLKNQTHGQRIAGILAFLDSAAFRPLSKEFVNGAKPILVGKSTIELWRNQNPELSGQSFPAIFPVSDDLWIAFEHGDGTGATVLRNYDFEGVSGYPLPAKIAATLDACSSALKTTELEKDVYQLPASHFDAATLEYGPRCGAPVLSLAFWSAVKSTFPEGAYIGFPSQLPYRYNELVTLLADKRNPDALALLRSVIARMAEPKIVKGEETKPTCEEMNRLRLEERAQDEEKSRKVNEVRRSRGMPEWGVIYTDDISKPLSEAQCDRLWSLKARQQENVRPPPQLSRHIYEIRDGKLVVAE